MIGRLGIRQFLHPESRGATTISPELGPKVRQGAFESVSHGAGEGLLQNSRESRSNRRANDFGEDGWKPSVQMVGKALGNTRKRFLQVLHPVKAALHPFIHGIHGFGMHRRNFLEALLKRGSVVCQGLAVPSLRRLESQPMFCVRGRNRAEELGHGVSDCLRILVDVTDTMTVTRVELDERV
jgi:hypothetical protein